LKINYKTLIMIRYRLLVTLTLEIEMKLKMFSRGLFVVAHLFLYTKIKESLTYIDFMR